MLFAGLWRTLEGSGGFWKVLEGFRRHRWTQKGAGYLWRALEGYAGLSRSLEVFEVSVGLLRTLESS